MRSAILIFIGFGETALTALIMIVWLGVACDADVLGGDSPCAAVMGHRYASGIYGWLVVAWCVSIWGLLRVERRFKKALLLQAALLVVGMCYLPFLGPTIGGMSQ